MHFSFSKAETKIKEVIEEYNLTKACLFITNACNENCKFCFRPIEVIRLNRRSLERIINLLQRTQIKEITLTGGEPTLFCDITIEAAKQLKKNGFRVKLITNAKILCTDILPYIDQIGFSIETFNPAKLLMLGKSPSFLTNINRYLKEIRERKLPIKIKINSVITSINGTSEDLESIAAFINMNSDVIYKWKLLKFLNIRHTKMKRKRNEDLTISDDAFFHLVKEAKSLVKNTIEVSSLTEKTPILLCYPNKILLFTNGKEDTVCSF